MLLSRTDSVRALRGALLSSLLLASSAFADEAARASFTTSSEDAHWGYDQPLSPEHWGELPGDAVCAQGVAQSPIAGVRGCRPPAPGRPQLPRRHQPRVHAQHGAHGAVHLRQWQHRPGGSNAYTLAQFHFHSPSEHTKDGVEYPLELHLVHTDANGTPALVVGVLIEESAVNAALFTAFRHLPRHMGEESVPAGALINASALLPHDKAFFQYAGSLTTPPCTQGLQWYVMKQPLQLSDAQIAAFERLPHLNPNNRHLQPLNGRTVSAHSGR